ncbi:MAG: hypothetical protein IKF64_02235 [Eubacterium sp.]|nr:hypothetical protein [Eubacterium sp.]
MARRKKSTKEVIENGLMKLATGDISDAVSLLYLSDEEAMERLPKLNLFNVSEIKRPKGGGLEIKFFDRIKAFERLGESSTADNSEGLGFYQALEKSIENAGSEKPEYD